MLSVLATVSVCTGDSARQESHGSTETDKNIGKYFGILLASSANGTPARSHAMTSSFLLSLSLCMRREVQSKRARPILIFWGQICSAKGGKKFVEQHSTFLNSPNSSSIVMMNSDQCVTMTVKGNHGNPFPNPPSTHNILTARIQMRFDMTFSFI